MSKRSQIPTDSWYREATVDELLHLWVHEMMHVILSKQLGYNNDPQTPERLKRIRSELKERRDDQAIG